jgi:hypothetical protein
LLFRFLDGTEDLMRQGVLLLLFVFQKVTDTPSENAVHHSIAGSP